MKYISFLALLCCIFSCNIFSSENREMRNHLMSERNEGAYVARTEVLLQAQATITQLEEKHQKEIALYQEKITSLITEIEHLKSHKSS